MYRIGEFYLKITAESKEEFFEEYDEAMKKIPDTALNKKWHRSHGRSLVGWDCGEYVYLIPLNNPTLKKIVASFKKGGWQIPP